MTHRITKSFQASALLAAVASFALLACNANEEPATTPENASAVVAVDSAGPGARRGARDKHHRPHNADEVMARFDLNGDDRITQEEVSQSRSRYRAERFSKLDADGDGKLTEAEAGRRRWRWMAAADADGDGAVTLDELQQADDQSQFGPQREGKAGKRGKGRRGGKGRGGGSRYKGHDPILRFDQNGDDVVTREEVVQGMAGRGPERFAEADENGDGKLTEAEAGPRKWKWMSAADADGDGAVTQAELQQAREQGKLGRHKGGKHRKGDKGRKGGKGHKRGHGGPGPDPR